MNYLMLLLPIFWTATISPSTLTADEFYQTRNQAELAICDHNYEEAKMLYSTILESKFIEHKDLENYLILCAKTDDFENFQKTAERLRYDGFDEGTLQGIAGRYFDIHLELPDINPAILRERDKLNFILRYDQIPRSDCPGYQEHCVETIKYIDSINYIQLKKIYEEKGSWFYEANRKVYWLVILHNSQWQRYWLLDEMKLALKNGEIPIETYIDLINRFHHNNKHLQEPKYQNDLLWIFDGKYYFEKVEYEEILNRKRQEVHFDNVADQKKKLIFQARQERQEFKFYIQYYNNYSGLPKETWEMLKKHYEPIDESILAPKE